RTVCNKRKHLFLVTAITVAAFAVSGLVLLQWRGFPSRLPANALAMLDQMHGNEAHRVIAANIEDFTLIKNDQLPRIGSQKSNAPLDFVLLGDSHAQFASSLFDKLGKEYGISGVVIS